MDHTNTKDVSILSRPTSIEKLNLETTNHRTSPRIPGTNKMSQPQRPAHPSTAAIREALSGVVRDPTCRVGIEVPEEVDTRLNNIIIPHHCIVGNHEHADSLSICCSVICAFIGGVPQGCYKQQFTHVENDGKPSEHEEGWDRYKKMDIVKNGQMCTFAYMGGLMVMAKPISEGQENYPYLQKRWEAYLAKTGLPNLVKEGDAGPTLKSLLGPVP